MDPHRTANDAFPYDYIMHGHPLRWWVELVHRHVSEKSQWTYAPLQPGAFGFDNMAVSVGRLLEACSPQMDLDTAADIVHRGWAENYTWWRDHAPACPPYRMPATPLGDKRRNSLAETAYANLPPEEKLKDQWIACCVLQELT